jgi:hypothetical protein
MIIEEETTRIDLQDNQSIKLSSLKGVVIARVNREKGFATTNNRWAVKEITAPPGTRAVVTTHLVQSDQVKRFIFV